MDGVPAVLAVLYLPENVVLAVFYRGSVADLAGLCQENAVAAVLYRGSVADLVDLAGLCQENAVAAVLYRESVADLADLCQENAVAAVLCRAVFVVLFFSLPLAVLQSQSVPAAPA
jgi:hypothetical protein